MAKDRTTLMEQTSKVHTPPETKYKKYGLDFDLASRQIVMCDILREIKSSEILVPCRVHHSTRSPSSALFGLIAKEVLTTTL